MTKTCPELFEHQKRGVEFALSRGGNCALFFEIGLGKTRTAIEIFTRLRQINPSLKLIVFAPLSLLESAWGEDIMQFSEFKYHNCHDGIFPVPLVADIFLMNYEMMIQDKNLKPILEMLNAKPFMAVCDESSRMKNAKSKTTKVLLKLAEKLKYRVVMSGTPAPNGLYEYWAQMQFVSPTVFHPSFYAFRNTFFHLQNKWTGKVQQGGFVTRESMREMMKRGFQYEITPANERSLMGRMEKWVIQAKKKDCLDLPEQIDEIRTVEMGPKQRVHYKEMKKHLVTILRGEAITAKVALARLMKLREVTSGFLIDEYDRSHEIGENPKLSELEAIIEEAGNQQVLIWCHFKKEIEDVTAMLERLGKKYVALYSETDEKNESIRAFKDGSVQYAVCHPLSAGHGLTFVGCSLQVFYSLSYSWEQYEQARGRIHRAGQRNACTYIHIVANDSIDQEIMKVLQKKQSAQDMIYHFLKDEKPKERVA